MHGQTSYRYLHHQSYSWTNFIQMSVPLVLFMDKLHTDIYTTSLIHGQTSYRYLHHQSYSWTNFIQIFVPLVLFMDNFIQISVPPVLFMDKLHTVIYATSLIHGQTSYRYL
ncbi:hypothetical protein CHS0354_007170 [Potamilus streckersoni]|uniref:Uncharacterized protein n=1 Tax=Potamilus streckersoni TaxID=2493646 RepID=A0AAE0T6C9_9BIVA|nr:hypothetical protein CHS0354_007170 [Potamilus streckersoni]